MARLTQGWLATIITVLSTRMALYSTTYRKQIVVLGHRWKVDPRSAPALFLSAIFQVLQYNLGFRHHLGVYFISSVEITSHFATLLLSALLPGKFQSALYRGCAIRWPCGKLCGFIRPRSLNFSPARDAAHDFAYQAPPLFSCNVEKIRGDWGRG